MDNKQPEFRFIVDGSDYALWTSASVNRSLDSSSGSFQLYLLNPDRTLIKNYRPSIACEIKLDDSLIAAGHLDGFDFDDSSGRLYTFNGRDRVADLIDCAATVDGSHEFTNMKLDDVAKAILKPFGMRLSVSGDVGRNFDRLSIEPGETAFAFIERACRYRGLMPISDGTSGLVLVKPGATKSSGKIVMGENVKTRNASVTHGQRYSQIIVKGQSSASDISNASDNAHASGRASDPAIQRYRPLVIQAEQGGYDLDMQERAEWEVRNRRHNGVKINYTVPGWKTPAGDFWTLNTLVPVIDEDLAINRDMLISGIRFNRSDSDGTSTQITVTPAEAFDLPPVRQSGDDDVWGGFN